MLRGYTPAAIQADYRVWAFGLGADMPHCGTAKVGATDLTGSRGPFRSSIDRTGFALAGPQTGHSLRRRKSESAPSR